MLGFVGSQEQPLPTTARPHTPTDQSRRNHTRVVQDHRVARLQILTQIANVRVVNVSTVAINDHQSRIRATRQWPLSNQFFWQVIVVGVNRIQVAILEKNTVRLGTVPHSLTAKPFSSQANPVTERSRRKFLTLKKIPDYENPFDEGVCERSRAARQSSREEPC